MWHFIFRIHLAAVILGKCHTNKDFVIYQRKLLCVAGLGIAFCSSLFFSPSPSFAPYSAFAGCFKSASHKKSLSQWNTAIWEIIEWWLGGTNASLRNYTTISPAFTTFLKASCHPGRKSPRLKIHCIFKPAWWHGSPNPGCNTTAHSSHSWYANTEATASLHPPNFALLYLLFSGKLSGFQQKSFDWMLVFYCIPCAASTGVMTGLKEFKKQTKKDLFSHTVIDPIHHEISHNYIIWVLLNKQPCRLWKN